MTGFPIFQKTRWLVGVLTLAIMAGCGQGGTPTQPGTRGQDGQAETSQPGPGGLLPRADIFATAQRNHVKVSPDGQRLAWVEHDTDQGDQLLISPVLEPTQTTIITHAEAGKSIKSLQWAGNNTHIVFTTANYADTQTQVHSVNIFDQTTRALSAQSGVTATVVGDSLDYVNDVVIAVNDRDRAVFDLYRVDVITGNKKRIYKNTKKLVTFLIDADLRLKVGYRAKPNGGSEMVARDSTGKYYRTVASWGPEDATGSLIIALDGAQTGVYTLDTTGRDTRAIVRIDLETGQRETLGGVAGADVDDVLIHPVTKVLDGFAVERLRREWFAASPSGADVLAQIEDALGPNFTVISRSLDDTVWTIQTNDARGQYFLLNRRTGQLSGLFASRDGLWFDIARKPVVIEADDGLTMVSHLTMPAASDADGNGVPDTPLPLIISLHEGPWSRSFSHHSDVDAWLANRGYAVLSINPRGSGGFGKGYMNAGAGAWGGKVVDDVRAAAKWAMAERVAAPDKIAIHGVYFGGHSALAALADEPDMYQCASGFNVPADLVLFSEQPPDRYRALSPVISRMVGDTNDPDIRAALEARNLRSISGDITKPILLIQGSRDVLEQSQLAIGAGVAAGESGVPITVLRVDETDQSAGVRPGQLLALAAIEHFFSTCLGGQAEPVDGILSDARGEIVFDAGGIPELAKALDKAG